jgi:membrane AbrB-like protein
MIRLPSARTLLHILLVYAGALVAGFGADALALPLPWMIGPLVFAMAVRLADRPIRVPLVTRPIGQILVASSVGLAFTPEAASAAASLIGWMLAATGLTIVAGWTAAAVVMRVARVDAVTATLASMPMGPVESANIAGRQQVEPGPVVFAQTLRIVLLVLFVPPALVWIDGSVHDPTAALRETAWAPSGALLLITAAVIGAAVMKVLGIANPFFVGPLAGAALAAAFALPITAYPYPVLAGAQVMLGVWLGATFDRDLVRRAGGLLSAAILSALVLIGLCALMGLGLAWATGLPLPVMILATAPGSVTEMALTAKVLEQGVAAVTAFHLLRIFIILPFAPVIIEATARAARRFRIGPPRPMRRS